jgi:hypothetical protein
VASNRKYSPQSMIEKQPEQHGGLGELYYAIRLLKNRNAALESIVRQLYHELGHSDAEATVLLDSIDARKVNP